MAAVRPVVTVYKVSGDKAGQVKTPAVLAANIRSDIVQNVFTHMSKNRRQPYAVKHMAGMGYAAESWGTGRAVARIPRVGGGGTGRSGQGAFGNQCRGGRMFSPTKTWRRWHRRTSTNQKRYAVASALAASALAPLVMARGHSIGRIPEVPLVVEDSFQAITKTKDALVALKKIGAYSDVARAFASRKVRSGVSRMRGRAHTSRRGPLIVLAKDEGISRAVRNLPGVDVANVNALNLLQLAPGGTLGRFIIWSQSAMEALNGIFGAVNRVATGKKGFHLAAPIMANPDLDRIISSNEIQSHLRAPRRSRTARPVKLNPLTNFRAKVALNPYAKHLRLAEISRAQRAKKEKAARLAAARSGKKLAPTQTEINARAEKKALAKSHAANWARVQSGVAHEKPGFDAKAYAAALKNKTRGAGPKDVVVKAGLSQREKAAKEAAKKFEAAYAKNRAAVSKFVKTAKAKKVVPAKAAAAAPKKK